MMKKSTFGAILAFLFAAAGALTAAALYLRRREKELDEYERLLYSDDGDDYDDDDEYLPIDNEPTEAAEEKAADDACTGLDAFWEEVADPCCAGQCCTCGIPAACRLPFGFGPRFFGRFT